MSDSLKKAKRDLRKLLARYLGKKLKSEEVAEILLNKNYSQFQYQKMIAIISHTEDSKLMQTALANVRNRGMNKAIEGFTEITQLGAFLSDLLPEKEGGTFGRGKDYEESEYL